MTRAGLPHSEIPGSKIICTSPRLIAAYHVLHRLLVPRHSPCALCSLTKRSLSRAANDDARVPEANLWAKHHRSTRRKTRTDLRCESVFDCQRPQKPPTRLQGSRKRLPHRNAKSRANSRSSCFWNQRWPSEAVVANPGPDLVGLGGVEPPTSRLSGVRSNQLSYRPGIV